LRALRSLEGESLSIPNPAFQCLCSTPLLRELR
jgi:hypothetical protein